MMKKLFSVAFLALLAMNGNAQRTTTLMNEGWTFSLGDASSMQKDFTHGTEYFTYFSKAGSNNQNMGPARNDFDDANWQKVDLPHDWVVDLPYAGEASHSHGYKQVGWKYPQNSVGWYRKHIFIPKEDEGKDISVRFEGIFRNSQVFCNGFYLGHEVSGYATTDYNLSEYLNYGGDNVITVRADASTEEGWYYEGAGIYRDVWLIKHPAHSANTKVSYQLLDAKGNVAAEAETLEGLKPANPHLWSLEDPYLYTQVTLYKENGKVIDEERVKTGIREVKFDLNKGVLLNGKALELKGVNLHLDHAGVGTAVPDSLWPYIIKRLQAMGGNAIRCSHNPATPSMLNACDSLGMLVIDENRLMGTNTEHHNLLARMINRDKHHPSIILWSIGNEEWVIENGERGEKIARTMVKWSKELDPTRLTTYGNAGGFGIVKDVDIHGYNYIVQNDVENRRRAFPDWFVVGTEETSGCGTRNVYWTDSVKGYMKSINMEGEERSNGFKNVIERGWQWYKKNPWAGGLFYWTGFDYRGEPNPMLWPATGSQFGILDYCGFPKDEAYYLKAAWTDQPVLHIFPHWNLPDDMKGKETEVWAYSNMDEVELFQDGKSLGRQKMPEDGHLVWKTIYKPGKLRAVGYKKGKKVLVENVETTGEAVKARVDLSKTQLCGSQDVAVADITLLDKKGREVKNACNNLQIEVSGAEILGWGNGDPGFKVKERPQNGESKTVQTIPAFMGKAQIILKAVEGNTQPVKVNVKL